MLLWREIRTTLILTSFHLFPISSFSPSNTHYQLIDFIARSCRSSSHIMSSTNEDTSTSQQQSLAHPQQSQEQPQPKAFTTSWEPEIAQLIHTKMQNAQDAHNEAKKKETWSKRPFLVALVGIPGSGKTTSAQILSDLLQQQQKTLLNSTSTTTNGNTVLSSDASSETTDSPVMVMPMDGYHLPLATLKTQPNSKDLIYRRGAPDTFDPRSLLNDLKQIRASGTSMNQNNRNEKNCDANDASFVRIPGFDHAKGDPQPNAYTYKPHQHSIVICEGLYLLHQEEHNDEDGKNNDNESDKKVDRIGGTWNEEIEQQFDLTIFINADIDTCIERLKVRNKCIPGYTPQEIDIRCDIVDRANAMLVLKSKDRAMYVVDSVVASSSSSS